MKSIPFINSYGSLSIILPPNQVSKFENNQSDMFAQIYFAPEHIAAKKVATSIPWMQKDRLNDPLSDKLQYFLLKVCEQRIALLNAKNHPESSYIVASIETLKEEKRKLKITFLDDKGTELTAWSAEIDPDQHTNEVIDEFIAQIVTPSIGTIDETTGNYSDEPTQPEEPAQPEEIIPPKTEKPQILGRRMPAKSMQVFSVGYIVPDRILSKEHYELLLSEITRMNQADWTNYSHPQVSYIRKVTKLLKEHEVAYLTDHTLPRKLTISGRVYSRGSLPEGSFAKIRKHIEQLLRLTKDLTVDTLFTSSGNESSYHITAQVQTTLSDPSILELFDEVYISSTSISLLPLLRITQVVEQVEQGVYFLHYVGYTSKITNNQKTGGVTLKPAFFIFLFSFTTSTLVFRPSYNRYE